MNSTVTNQTAENLAKVVAFLQSIGMVVHFASVDTATLLPGIKIAAGEIIIDEQQIKYPGDILHEAGHIAVVPAAEPNTLNEDTIGTREQSGAEEMMAIAWSYAVCVHIGINASFVFHDDGYKGGGQQHCRKF
ncbi:MAG: hypothetical protein K2X48_01235 [Chitinophagaceae bacterium]|nr:hypothetical protein [Chitinophagaceae bacterium]